MKQNLTYLATDSVNNDFASLLHWTTCCKVAQFNI